jgi:glycerate-2-kinase
LNGARSESPELLRFSRQLQASLAPEATLSKEVRRHLKTFDALLFWGKAARAQWELLSTGDRPELRVVGNHPLPGTQSFEAGWRILEFFDLLRRERVRSLGVLLSGGASSQAWLRPADVSEDALQARLTELYRAPLSIQKLNAARGRLCALKSGGSARWLARLAPGVRAEVFVLSDVLPFGPEVVGSGPFAVREVRHRVLADGATAVRAAARAAEGEGLRVVRADAGVLGDWSRFGGELEGLAPGTAWAVGGESQIHVGGGDGASRGGRLSHVACRLLERLHSPISAGRLEILALATDGHDGLSGGAGVMLTASVTRVLRKASLRQAVARFDTGPALARAGALLPSSETGTNLQDLLVVFGRRLPAR